MQDVISALGGFRGVRAELLVALKKAQPLTAHELGEQFGLTANGLRRYLKALEEDGLVRYERAVHGVGAPVFAYSLAPAGEALFPRSYVSVLATALDALRAEQGTAAVAGVFAGLTVQLRPNMGVELLLPVPLRSPLMAVLSMKKSPLNGLSCMSAHISRDTRLSIPNKLSRHVQIRLLKNIRARVELLLTQL